MSAKKTKPKAKALTLNQYQKAVKVKGTCLCNGGRGWCARCYGT